MDVAGIGLTALGPHARTLPKSERPTYYSGMINFIAKYAAKTSPQYPVASATVTGQGPGDAGGTNVDSRITLRSGDGYDVRWLVVKSGSGYKVPRRASRRFLDDVVSQRSLSELHLGERQQPAGARSGFEPLEGLLFRASHENLRWSARRDAAAFDARWAGATSRRPGLMRL